MKVFVSSTVFDLIDVRAEVADLLRFCDIAPVLSDDKLSDFAIKPDNNSIETCLVNVDACDEMIVILDKRYGPRLGAYGYEDVSATHLEYHRFLQTKRQIHFFVRDRLEGDFGIWKKNGKKDDMDFTWIGKNQIGLFHFLEERRTLTAEKDKPNWFTTFTSSSDLKAALTKYYDEAFLPQRLADAIYNNTFPAIVVNVASECLAVSIAGNVYALYFEGTNTGMTTALNVAHSETNTFTNATKINVAPQHTAKLWTKKTPLSPSPSYFPLFLSYESRIGIKVEEEYEIGACLVGDSIQVECKPQSRRFVKCGKPSFTICDT
jgi:hypothetical protein